MKSPCVNDCPGRSPTCHCTCEKYAAFAQQRKQSYDRPHTPLSGRDQILTEGRLLAREKAIKDRHRKHR